LAAHEKLTIHTPEQIALEFTLAGAGSRFLALAIDTIVQVFVSVTILLLFAAGAWLRVAGVTSAGTWVQAAGVIFGFILYYGYFAFFEAIWTGQTPGKRIVGLRVISLSGRPIAPFDSILRNLLRIIDQIPGIYAVGIVSILVTARSQRLGDLAAGTVVVLEDWQTAHAAPKSFVPSAAGVLGAAKLTPKEVEAIETFLGRRGALPDAKREQAAQQLAEHLRQRLSVPADRYRSDEALLEDAIAEYRGTGRAR
jgi:uncharacterized RDD family membrane protein YckC